MLKRIRDWYDWKIYWLFYRSVNRIMRNNPGMAYLLELHMRHWRERGDMPESLKRSTEVFFETQMEAKKGGAVS